MVRGMPEASALEPDDDDADAEPFRRSVLDFLAELIAQGPVDVYPCWYDDEGARPDAHRKATLADLKADGSLLRERRLTHLTG